MLDTTLDGTPRILGHYVLLFQLLRKLNHFSTTIQPGEVI
jgi:hypothetical protein